MTDNRRMFKTFNVLGIDLNRKHQQPYHRWTGPLVSPPPLSRETGIEVRGQSVAERAGMIGWSQRSAWIDAGD